MANAQSWIHHRIAEAAKRYSSMPKPVLSRMAALLGGQLTERQLPKADLKDIANKLIVAMASTPQDRETKQ